MYVEAKSDVRYGCCVETSSCGSLKEVLGNSRPSLNGTPGRLEPKFRSMSPLESKSSGLKFSGSKFSKSMLEKSVWSAMFEN